METKDIIKYAAIAVGAYLVYTYVIAPMMNATPAVAAAPPTPPGTPVANPTGTTPPAPPQAVCPSGTTGTPPNCIAIAAPPVVAKVGKYPYTDKSSYQQALVNAAVDAAGGDPSITHTADEWNWYMVNSIGVNFAPAPDGAMAPGQRFTPITAAVYYDALRHQGMLDYPSGLSGMGDIIRMPSGLGTFWGVN